MDLDIQKVIKIDENNLEGEWAEQASYFLYFATAHAEALYIKDIKKSKLEYIYAIMYSNIKKDWSKLFDSKPTEPAIKAYIETNSKYKKAERTYINACKDANLMLSAKQALEHRKKALENKVSLKIGGFFSEPRNKNKDIQNLIEMKKEQKKALKKRKRAKTR